MTGVQTCALPISPQPHPEFDDNARYDDAVQEQSEQEMKDRATANRHPLFFAQLPDFMAAGYKPSDAEQIALGRLNE